MYKSQVGNSWRSGNSLKKAGCSSSKPLFPRTKGFVRIVRMIAGGQSHFRLGNESTSTPALVINVANIPASVVAMTVEICVILETEHRDTSEGYHHRRRRWRLGFQLRILAARESCRPLLRRWPRLKGCPAEARWHDRRRTIFPKASCLRPFM